MHRRRFLRSVAAAIAGVATGADALYRLAGSDSDLYVINWYDEVLRRRHVMQAIIREVNRRTWLMSQARPDDSLPPG